MVLHIPDLSFTQVSLLAGGAVLLWITASSYLSWARLRHIPGPFLASVSHLWLLKLNLSGRVWETYRDLFKKYPGSLVRVAPNMLTTNDPELMRKMSAARSRYGKDRWYIGGRFNPNTDIMFNMLDPKLHDAAKAKMAGAYTGSAAAGLEPIVDEQMASLVELIHSRYLSGSDFRLVEFGNLLNYYTLDIITKAGFGQEFGYLASDSDVYGFLEEVRNVTPFVGLTADIPWIRDTFYSKPFQALFGPKLTDKKGFGKLMGVGRQLVEERFLPGWEKGENDMMSSFIANGMTLEECESEAIFMILAGSETSASVMRITLLNIMTRPNVYGKLKAEIRGAISDGRVSNPIQHAEAKTLPYLQAVVYEGLRMRPPTLNLFVKSTPPEGDTIDGVFVPGNVGIGHDISAMLARTDLFGPDAELFRPERFLEATPEHRLEMERNTELVFGHGRWMCAGKQIAFMELNKTFFELLRHFDLEFANTQQPCVSASYVVHTESNMWVKVTKAEEV